MKTINTYINEKLRLTTKHQYTCQPRDFFELQCIIRDRIKNEGNECDLNDIDVSKITDMSRLFEGQRKFNCDISMWNVSNAENMDAMFMVCEEFNCDLSMWDMSNATNIRCMFCGCKKFNQNLNSWNVSNVKDMYNAFNECPTTPKWYDKKTMGIIL